MLEYTLFQHLPLSNQVELVTRQGTALAQRNHKGWNITLYELNNYFVERWEKSGLEIMGTFKKSASHLAILEPYIDHLEVQPFLDV
ncbi:hypothetical protein AHMF7605_26330 [Adhaeribacter arboris]|uniref:Uncharacterized protein n=1 Tax=Adhaeribacter arboris TaxID=2072846 RepID=A0A2T2YMM5_9BACT|nr:hypothetical protein [Adhaeribacter arboris]PSR56762.1 hypothetical protein AHMF7605_26330 [Adhaeribacter arboris]